MIRQAAICGVLLLAGGCASMPPAADSGDWPLRRTELQALGAWTLNGRVAVATAAEGFSGGLAWRQDGAQSDISLRGPLGGVALAIRLEGSQMTVTDGSGNSIAGEAAEDYVASEIGAPLPVSELRYWLVGVPSPRLPSQEALGADGRLAGLEQAGWRLRYSRYQTVDGHALPSRVDIESQSTRLRLVVASWRLGP